MSTTNSNDIYLNEDAANNGIHEHESDSKGFFSVGSLSIEDLEDYEEGYVHTMRNDGISFHPIVEAVGLQNSLTRFPIADKDGYHNCRQYYKDPSYNCNGGIMEESLELEALDNVTGGVASDVSLGQVTMRMEEMVDDIQSAFSVASQHGSLGNAVHSHTTAVSRESDAAVSMSDTQNRAARYVSTTRLKICGSQ